MPTRDVRTIVIHCSATANGVPLGRPWTRSHPGISAAAVIDGWHRQREFKRDPVRISTFNPHLLSIGYHWVIDVDGTVESGRHEEERGAHAAGHNIHTIGVCVVGTDKFTQHQWRSMRFKMLELIMRYRQPRICGHRDLSPDKDGDGKVERQEWLKTCPGFEVTEWWLSRHFQPMEGHIFGGN